MEKKWAYLHLLFCSCLAVLRLASAFAVHQGCYISSANGARAFPFKAAASDSMTIEVCRSAAATRFVDSFSLEAGRECWLDPLNGNLTSLTRFGAGGACNTSCAGDTRIVCGGQQQASVYLENDATPAVVPPNDYLPVGCFKDDAAARRLTLLWVANSSMTVDLCANIAFNEQWLVFGVQGGSECWAGQAADSARVLGPSSGCTTACPGNSTQSCGGPLALSLYALKNAPWVEADSTTTTTSEPKALIAASCVGAAASSDACKALMSAAAPVVVPHLMALLAAVLAAALWY